MRDGDRVVGKFCPQCGGEVVYNGNYFCVEEDCWIMEEDGPEYGIVKAYLIQRLVIAQQKGDDDEVQRMSFHLLSNKYVKDGEVIR